MIQITKKLSATFIFMLFFVAAFSQIVNVEKNRKKNKNGFQGTTSFDLSIKETSKTITEFKNNLDIQYKYNANTFIFLNSIRFLRVDTGNIINDGFQHLRYNYTFKDSSFVTAEFFGQLQYNANKHLRKRILAGAGPRFRIIDKEKFSVYSAPLVMYESEQLSDIENTISNSLRLDLYLNFNLKIGKSLSFSNITYYQPWFQNFSDYRLSSETSLRFSITKHFALNASYSIEYDARPPAEVQDLFYKFKTKLIFMI